MINLMKANTVSVLINFLLDKFIRQFSNKKLIKTETVLAFIKLTSSTVVTTKQNDSS